MSFMIAALLCLSQVQALQEPPVVKFPQEWNTNWITRDFKVVYDSHLLDGWDNEGLIYHDDGMTNNWRCAIATAQTENNLHWILSEIKAEEAATRHGRKTLQGATRKDVWEDLEWIRGFERLRIVDRLRHLSVRFKAELLALPSRSGMAKFDPSRLPEDEKLIEKLSAATK